MFRLLTVFLVPILLFCQAAEIDSSRLRAHIRFLSSDLLEGRFPGTRGGQLTEQYLVSAFEAAGAKVQLQAVPFMGLSMDPASKISFNGSDLGWRTEVFATTTTQKESVTVSGQLVFAGYAIRESKLSPENYPRLDAKGKIIVFRSGPSPGIIQKENMTFTSLIEEISSLGASGVLFISKSLPPNMGAEQLQLQTEPKESSVQFLGFISEVAAQKLGWPLTDLFAKAGTPGFEPVPLPGTARIELKSISRKFQAHNVIATIAGSDPILAGEQVLYSAHWDHLGLSASGDDRIFNGAVDNATGCAALVEIARTWAGIEPKPKRSAVFIATTGEESRLLGATYYAANPVFPLQRVKIGLNLDALAPGAKPTGFFALGPAHAESLSLIEEGGRRLSLPLRPDPKPELGLINRADHSAFMKSGVPAFSLMPLDETGQFSSKYMSTKYHKTSDEYSPDWDMTSNETMSRLAFTIGISAASRP